MISLMITRMLITMMTMLIMIPASSASICSSYTSFRTDNAELII